KSRLPPANLLPLLPHPRIPCPRPLDNPKLRCIRIPMHSSAPLTQKLPIPHPPLLPQSRTILLFNKPIEFALYSLETASRSIRKLTTEPLPHFFPLLVQIYPVVPDEVHFFFFVLRSWWT